MDVPRVDSSVDTSLPEYDYRVVSVNVAVDVFENGS